MSDIFKGAADVTRYVMIVDSTTGAPETGVTIANLDMQYTRNRTAPAVKVDMVALAATDTAHTDGRGIEVDATSSPGLYRIDWPDAAFATGVDKVLLVVTGTGFAPAVELIDLVNVNNQVAYVPNAAADAAGGLPISDAGGLDLDAIKTDTAAILVDTGTTLDARIPAALTANGNMKSSLMEILTTALTETAGQLAAGFKKFFNVAAPASTMEVIARVTLTDTVTTYTGDTPQTGDSFARIGANGVSLTSVGITSNIKKNQALAGFTFLMTDSTNHAPATGLTVAVTRSIDGGAFAAGTLSAVTEVGNGIYSVDFGAGDLNGKVIVLQATEAASDSTFERIVTQA